MTNSIFWQPHRVLTYNTLFNFIIGNRGGGKTFGGKETAIRQFLKHGSQFIYLRRYKSEIDDMQGFFGDVSEKFQGHEFEVKGKKLYIDGKLAGYLVALSNALVKKSVNYNKVQLIIFDEFVIDKGNLHYLKNEVVKFLEFYETVARMREGVRVLFLSNAVSVVNPYFLYWNIRPKQNKEFTRMGHMLIQFVANKEFIEEKYKTAFGQIIKGTEYGNYAIENEFLVDNENFVEKRTPNAKPVATITYLTHTYGFWIDYKAGKFFVSDKHDPSTVLHYAVTDSDHKPNIMLVRSKSKGFYLDQFLKAYELGYCYFDNLTIKNQCLEIFKILKG